MLNKHVSSGWSGQAGFHTLCAGDGSQIAFVVRAGFAPCSRGRELVKIALLCFCLIFAVATPARAQGIFTNFDVPGAGTGVLQGTLGVSINAAGHITGMYIGASPVYRGFVRAADGTITHLDAPDAGTGTGQGTFPTSINAAGVIAGTYFDTDNAYHGFVRAADGAITEFDVPAAGTGGHRGTLPTSINTAGDITGIYKDPSALRHGFLRPANGPIIYPIDVPGAGTGLRQGTMPLSINSAGVITGVYSDASGVGHGFVRAANGTITAPIDVPGAGTSGRFGDKDLAHLGTLPTSINSAADIAGVYADASGVQHGFMRAADGTMTYPIDAPGVGTTGVLPGTTPFSINTGGVIAGSYEDAGGVVHGFVRAADGTMIAPIDDPNAGGAGTSLLPGTFIFSINDSGVITGGYFEADGAFQGYVLTITPQGQISNLQNIVEDFVSARTLSPGQGQFLLAPLNEALAALGPATATAVQPASNSSRGEAAPASLDDPGDTTAERITRNRGHAAAAIRELDEFIGRVRLLVILRRLKPAEGRTLIDAAESIISTLRSKP